MLMAALAPAVSSALALARSHDATVEEALAEACAAHPDPLGPKAPKGHHTFEHCPFCSLHADAAPPPAPVAAQLAVPVRYRPVAPAFLHAPRSRWVWAAAQPRAPPRMA
jgi:hypothetical protein